MMFPEDRVLVGIINRKRDFKILQEQHWYRIPQRQMPRGINAEYLAFFLSGSVFKEQSGGVHYFARYRGVELVYRRDLLPEQPDHVRADDPYYKVILEDIQTKIPPVLNTDKRTITFVRTTWDRFTQARSIRDLYSTSDYFVDRIYHALRNRGIRSEHFWENESKDYDYAPAVRVVCEQGAFTATTQDDSEGFFKLDASQDEDSILKEILAHIKSLGGPVSVPLFYD
ncbi:MAG: hypothetical protein RLP44_25375 [Aggregatilineales bacterium]